MTPSFTPRVTAYLDYNASAPIPPEIAAAVRPWLDGVGNASSVHGFGRRVRSVIEDAREAVAASLSARVANVIFTSGATEANALAMHGLAARPEHRFASAIEHVSILDHLPAGNRLSVTTDGILDLDAAAERIAAMPPGAVVAVMLANNETGVVQPVRAVAALAHARGVHVHCDAVQGWGRLPISIAELGVDSLAVSGHKLGGPAGSGALILAEDVTIAPLIVGGGQERGRRGGTENVIGIVGLGAAARLVPDRIADQDRQRRLRDDLETWILKSCRTAVVHGAAAMRIANTTCVSVPGLSSATQVIALDLAGVAVSAGAACSSGRVADSHVLKAMGVAPERVGSAIRVSVGAGTTAADVDAFRAAWAPLIAARAA